MKNFNIKGLRTLKDLYQEKLEERAPESAPFVSLLYFLEKKGRLFEFTFEIQGKYNQPEAPKGIFAKAYALFPQLNLEEGERALSKKFGMKIVTQKGDTEIGPHYSKIIRAPTGVFPQELAEGYDSLARRIGILTEEIGNLIEKALKIHEDDYASQDVLRPLAEAIKLYKEAKGEGYDEDRKSCIRAIQKFSGLGRGLIVEGI